jgi:hypothetical protein
MRSNQESVPLYSGGGLTVWPQLALGERSLGFQERFEATVTQYYWIQVVSSFRRWVLLCLLMVKRNLLVRRRDLQHDVFSDAPEEDAISET